MKIKTAELIGPALDWAVAKCEGYEYNIESGLLYKFKEPHFFKPYSTDWAQGGPIIERELINLRAIRKEGHSMNGEWLAAYDNGNTGTMVKWVKREDWSGHYLSGPTPLIAGMRCYVASKLGDEVDVPEGLV